MSKKFSHRQQAKARNLVVKDMILRGGGTPIAPNKRVKRASERAEIDREIEDYEEDARERDGFRSRNRDYNDG